MQELYKVVILFLLFEDRNKNLISVIDILFLLDYKSFSMVIDCIISYKFR